MIFDNFFKNVTFINYPKKNNLVLFSCDELYFKNYGYYNLISCLKQGHNLHVHIINPTTLDELKTIYHKNLSISYEVVDTNLVNKYQLKTYYYCSRFIITDYLFDNLKIESCLITDADVFFNKYVTIDNSVSLGLMYNPNETALWKKVSAPVSYFTKKSKKYLKSVIETYTQKVNYTDFSVLETITDKYERGNILGLDQVCLALNLKQEIIEDNFLNLNSLDDLLSKKEDISKIWILTNGNLKSDPNFRAKLEEKIKD